MQSSEIPPHVCRIHTEEQEPLLFVCLTDKCFTQGLLCFHCRTERHPGKTHNIRTIEQLKGEVQNTAFDKTVPEGVHAHVRLVKDARLKCLNYIHDVRNSIEQVVLQAEKSASLLFDQMEKEAEAHGGSKLDPSELKIDQPTPEFNKKVVEAMQSIIELRQKAMAIENSQNDTITVVNKMDKYGLESLPKLSQIISESLALLLQPFITAGKQQTNEIQREQGEPQKLTNPQQYLQPAHMVRPLMKTGQAFNLADLGIDPKFFRWSVTNMQSEKYITVRDVDENGAGQLTTVVVQNEMSVSRRPINKADGLMHPFHNIVALKAINEVHGRGYLLQIYNLDEKRKLKNVEFSENIVYWRWVNAAKLAVVTSTSVYHINIEDESNEVKILERLGELKENPTTHTQIVGYCLEPDEKWSALVGISTPDQGKTINGHIQLYFIEQSKQQLLEGHACTFGKAYIHNESFQSTLFCFVEKKQGQAVAKVHINEVSAAPEGQTKHKKNTEIQYDPSFPGDFPISLIVSEKYGLLYIVTKFGFLFVYELMSCEQIFRTRLSHEAIFVVTKNYTNDGILAIDKSGSVIYGSVDAAMLIPALLNAHHIPIIQIP